MLFEIIFNTKFYIYKILSVDLSNDQDFAKLTGRLEKGGRGVDNVEYGISNWVNNTFIR